MKTIVAVAVALAFAVPGVASAHSDHPGEGWFEIKCGVAIPGADIDPLVFPGTVGISHTHQFAGNRSINENSTNASLRASPATTCQDDFEEKAHLAEADRWYGNAIWYPRFYDNGAPLTASRVTSGYSVGFTRDFANIQPFGADHNFIAGSSAGGPSEINGQRVYSFACPGGQTTAGTARIAPLCSTAALRVTIFAPDCSDGRATAANHKDHMAYSKQAAAGSTHRVCPVSHPILVPAHRIMVELPTRGGSALTVATGSGETKRTTGDMSTLHYDYMSAVAEDAAANVTSGVDERTGRTDRCLNENEYCGGVQFPVPNHGGGI
jgi:hypothetical protein